MKRTIYAALAATVALPMLTIPAAAQQGSGYGYSPSGDRGYQWSENRGVIERDAYYAGEGRAPNPPRTPDRYITDWNPYSDGPGAPGAYAGEGRPPNPPRTPERYITDWNPYTGGDRGPGWRPQADDRWAERPNYDREFNRPSPPPGHPEYQAYGEGYQRGYDIGSRYADGPSGGVDEGSYHRGYRDERGFDPYSQYRWAGRDDRERMHREMRRRHHGYQDWDFRRDFSEDGRRGYYQDPSYEGMPSGRQRMGAGPGEGPPVDMRRIREAMRMIDRFDVDKDGRVTQEEVDQYRSDRLSQFDTDDDQQLTVDEYAGLWADAMRGRMVRRFQRHDRDGDGRVTVAEFSDQTGDIVRMRDRNRDDALSEDDFMRPRVEAPMGGSPNQPAESRVVGDDDVSDYDTRPEVEAPIEGTPNEPAGAAAEEMEDEDTTND